MDPNGPIGADCELLADLFLNAIGAEGDQRDRPAVFLLELDGSLNRALLMRAECEAELVGVDGHPVLGQHDCAAERGIALDANADFHQLTIRSLFGSNSGVAPTRSTTTG